MSRKKTRKLRGRRLEAQIRAAQMPLNRATAWNGGHIDANGYGWGGYGLAPLGLFYGLGWL